MEEREGKKCELHPFKELEIYCDNCNRPICSICACERIHSGHTCLHLHSIGETLSSQIDHLVKTISTKISKIVSNKKKLLFASEKFKSLFLREIDFYKMVKTEVDRILEQKMKTLREKMQAVETCLDEENSKVRENLKQIGLGIQENIKKQEYYLIYKNKEDIDFENKKLSKMDTTLDEIEGGDIALHKKDQNLYLERKEMIKQINTFLQTLELKSYHQEYQSSPKYSRPRTVQILQESHTSFIHCFLKNGENLDLLVYELDKENCIKHRALENANLLNGWDSIQLEERIILTGGFTSTKSYSKQTLLLSSPLWKEEKKGELLMEKGYHKMIHLEKRDMIYLIGGYNSTGNLNTCEKYRVSKDQWVSGPCLNQKRQQTTPVSFNNRLLFVLAGNNSNGNLDSIEVLKLNDERTGWNYLVLTKNIGWTPRFNCAAKQINPELVLVFGGYGTDFLKDSYLFSAEKGEIVKMAENMLKGDNFFERINSIIINGIVYTLGYCDKDIHMFNIHEAKWYIKETKHW